MKTIPQNKIIQSKGLGDTIGDIVSSFNLDLSSNYGAATTTRLKKVTTTNVLGDGVPYAIKQFGGSYIAAMANCIMGGGIQAGDEFTNVENITGLDVTKSDMELFNSKIYVATTESLYSSSNGSTFTEVVTGLNDSPHILEEYTARLYITDNYTTVVSISDSDVLATTGSTYAIDLKLGSDWTITTLRRVGSLLWIGCLNVVTGIGKVYSWDGESDIPNQQFELPAGVVAGVSFGNVLYILDTQGKLKAYAGNDFIEKARLPKKNRNHFSGVLSSENNRFIHPNGMVTTDDGTILILIKNTNSDGTYEDEIPSGVWEYDDNIGLYHKYSISNSNVGSTDYNDFGQERLHRVGAIYTGKPPIGSTTDNGVMLVGAAYYPTGSLSAPYVYGLWCDDTLETTLRGGSFTTIKIFSKIQEQWQKIYALYKKLSNTTSKILIKYRTFDDVPTESTITWTDYDRFTSSVSLSSYSVGDEVHIVQGIGSGITSHIKEINGSTYILDTIYPTACIGTTSKALISKWKKAGNEISYTDEQQFKALTLSEKNTSPMVQMKVCMNFNGKDELNKLQIISKEQVKEE